MFETRKFWKVYLKLKISDLCLTWCQTSHNDRRNNYSYVSEWNVSMSLAFWFCLICKRLKTVNLNESRGNDGVLFQIQFFFKGIAGKNSSEISWRITWICACWWYIDWLLDTKQRVFFLLGGRLTIDSCYLLL